MKINTGDEVISGKFDPHSDFKVPEGAKPPTSVMKLDVTVKDATPQPLKKLRPFPSMVLRIAGGWPKQAQMVLQALFACFDKAGNVSEGLVGDLMWGFQQAGLPPELTLHGLIQLETMGFIKFQAPDNQYVSLQDSASEKAWVRYQKPLLDQVYEG